MNLSEVPLMSMLRERMTWLNQRQGVLAQNVANADTPGYAARDLKPMDFSQALRSASAPNMGNVRVTDAQHISVRARSPSQFADFETRDIAANPNGNSVSLDMQMIKVSETQAQFQAAANLYAKAMTLMKTAIGR